MRPSGRLIASLISSITFWPSVVALSMSFATIWPAATRVRERTAQKGKALFHPIRLVLTGEAEGLELDLAVPAIEAGASLQASGIKRILGAAERAREFASALNGS